VTPRTTDLLYSRYDEFNKALREGKNTYTDAYDEFVYDLANRLSAAPVAVLDLGCGSGAKLRTLVSPKMARLVGVDQLVSPTANPVELVKLDILDIDNWPSGTFDLIIINDVLEHLTLDEIIKVLAAAGSRIKDNGYIFVKVPNGSSPFGGVYQNGDLTHKTFLGQFSFLQLAPVCDLEVAEFQSERLALRRYHNPIKRVTVAALQAVGRFMLLLVSLLLFRRKIVMTPNILVVLRRRQRM
jgi:SAM-dependent methyltransferase